jgi:hypothetical protein
MRADQLKLKIQYEKGEIGISGIATFRRHSLPTQPRREREYG